MHFYFQAPYIDKTDFLNSAVKEKMKFEHSLDDSVALGLNAGTEVLMNQVYFCYVFLSETLIAYVRWSISLLCLQEQENIIPRKMPL